MQAEEERRKAQIEAKRLEQEQKDKAMKDAIANSKKKSGLKPMKEVPNPYK